MATTTTICAAPIARGPWRGRSATGSIAGF